MGRLIMVIFGTVVATTVLSLLIVGSISVKNQKIPVSSPDVQTPLPGLPDEDIVYFIKEEIRREYGHDHEEISVGISEKSGDYASGTYQTKDSATENFWYGYHDGNSWQLIYEGRTTISCNLAEEYAFPASLVTQCSKEEQNETFMGF